MSVTSQSYPVNDDTCLDFLMCLCVLIFFNNGIHTYILWIQGELLEGDNSYFCEKCAKKRNTIKRMCIRDTAGWYAHALCVKLCGLWEDLSDRPISSHPCTSSLSHYYDTGVYIFLFAPPPRGGGINMSLWGVEEKVITSLSKKKKKCKEKGKGKEGKRERKRERKRGKRRK